MLQWNLVLRKSYTKNTTLRRTGFLMILTCPQCASRFSLPVEQLGEEGRHVKCSECGEVWHQLPDPEALSDEQGGAEESAQEDGQEDGLAQPNPIGDDDFGDIPDAVKPKPDQEDEQGDDDFSDIKQKILPIIVSAAPSALASFLIIFAALLFLHKPIVSAVPGMMGFYSALGISSPLPGEGLVFDALKVDVKMKSGHEQLHISGKIINLTSMVQMVPWVAATVKDKDGHDVGYVLIDPHASEVEAQGELDFSGVYNGSEKGESVSLRFVLNAQVGASKTDGEGGDSNHAHRADETAHQSGDAAHAGSQGHGSAPAHQGSQHGHQAKPHH